MRSFCFLPIPIFNPFNYGNLTYMLPSNVRISPLLPKIVAMP